MIETTLSVQTERFGEIQVDEEHIFRLESPLPGFNESERYTLLRPPAFRPFCWFQSMDEPQVCLPVIDPFQYFPDYKPDLTQDMLAALEVGEEGELAIFCVVSPHNGGLCANLLAPIVLHQAKCRAGQFILEGSDFHLAQPLESEC